MDFAICESLTNEQWGRGGTGGKVKLKLMTKDFGATNYN